MSPVIELVSCQWALGRSDQGQRVSTLGIFSGRKWRSKSILARKNRSSRMW